MCLISLLKKGGSWGEGGGYPVSATGYRVEAFVSWTYML